MTYSFAWLTDIHLNFLSPKARLDFLSELKKLEVNSFLITGDIGEAGTLQKILEEMQLLLEKPIHFVLGNHDYYGSSVKEVRDSIKKYCSKNNLIWLGNKKTVWLTENTVLIGEDGWADGQYGDFKNSRIILNDSRCIEELNVGRMELSPLMRPQLRKKMQKLASKDAKNLDKNLFELLNSDASFDKMLPKEIIIATHVPPYAESAWYNGKQSGDDWLPFFTSKIMGEVILKYAHSYPFINFLVLCGHTHERRMVQIAHNLQVHTGGNEYYHPQLQEIIKCN